MAFDYGARRIGVAVGQTATGSASAVGVIPVQGQPDWEALTRQVRQWVPQRLVVGIPYNKDGTESALTAACRAFAERLEGRFGLPIDLIDERLTSAAATDELREARRSGQKIRRIRRAEIDSHAARLILESWMSEHKHEPGSTP